MKQRRFHIYQETVINWSTGDKFLEVATTEKKIINRLRKLGFEHYRTQNFFYCFEVPFEYVTIAPPRKISKKNRLKSSMRMRTQGINKKKNKN